jgi:hypothetical protein
LHADEYATATEGHESQSFRCPEQLLEEKIHAVRPDDESDEIGDHHHEDVEYGADGTDVSVPRESAILSMGSFNSQERKRERQNSAPWMLEEDRTLPVQAQRTG